MQNNENVLNSTTIPIQSQLLWFLTLAYSMLIVLANCVDARLINIFSLNTDAGTLVFPFTFLLADIITEVYGYKHARRAIWCGFLFNMLFIIYVQIIINLPSPEYATNNWMFDEMLATSARIILASTISYFSSEPLNSLLMAKLKMKLQGRYMGMRFVLSTVFASGVDSVIFGVIAFYNVIDNSNLSLLILSMWIIKVLIQIIVLPLSISFAKKLKKLEMLDIYDSGTKFNLFSLDVDYRGGNNRFMRNER